MIKNAMKLFVSSVLVWCAGIMIQMSNAEDSSTDHQTTIAIGISSTGGVHQQLHQSLDSHRLLRSSNDAMSTSNITISSFIDDPFARLERFRQIKETIQKEVKERTRQEKAKARDALKRMPPPRQRDLEKVSTEEFNRMTAKQKERGLNWFSDSASGSVNGGSISAEVLLDPSQYYDKWAQAYRMLGGYIDCDHDKSQNNHHSGDNQQQQNDQEKTACSRWMIWASYVNPNYQGNEYDEYFGNNPTSVLDCHSRDTEWVLLGVYRQEFYQYVEQISKHLWAVDEYEYVVALAGLAYMTKYECFQVGNDNYGNAIKASVAPKPYGKWEIALYTDEYCLVPDESLGKTYDDFGMGSNVNLGSKDKNDDFSSVEEWWYDAQEYTLTNMNDVYEEFKYCTSCVDYPTYQDGYFIGDYGTDDDDLINQCWKFYSHSSYTCEAECIAMAHAQGNILSIKYGNTVFGKSSQSFYEHSALPTSTHVESPMSRLLASAFLTVSFILFIATFLAFAVARRSRYRESRSSKSRRLLEGQEGGRSGRSSRRSKSKTPSDGDGLFRESRSKSSTRRGSSSKRSSSRRRSRSKSYDAPKEKLRRASSPRSNDG